MVQFLLEAGTNKDIVTPEGATLLDIANRWRLSLSAEKLIMSEEPKDKEEMVNAS